MIEKSWPHIHSISSAPSPAEGRVEMIVSGCTKLSYSTPRMMYTATSAARISHGWLARELWKACAAPWKLPLMVLGMPISFFA